jgi:hypothetical protein
MKSHSEYSDQEFLKAFQDCTLAEELFNHEAHLRLAWFQVTNGVEALAIQNVTVLLLKYTKHLGASDIFNLELTVAAVKLVAKLNSLDTYETFESFMNRNPRLMNDFKGLLKEHYQLDL